MASFEFPYYDSWYFAYLNSLPRPVPHLWSLRNNDPAQVYEKFIAGQGEIIQNSNNGRLQSAHKRYKTFLKMKEITSVGTPINIGRGDLNLIFTNLDIC
jgi:hypothetical protein